MTTTVKGLFKGIRYITHLFGVAHQKEEPEIEIGGPTDVKHVSHIGWNGPTTNPPSWMNQFKADGEPLDPASNDENNNNQIPLGPSSAPPSPSSKRKKTKIKRRKASADSLGGSLTSKGSAATSPSHDLPKKHRKKKSKASTSSSSSIGLAASDNPAVNR